MAYTKVTGALVGSLSDLDLTNVGDIQLDSITGDGDTNTSITFSGSDVITIATGGSGRLTIGDGALSPVTDNQIDLGTSSLEFKDAFFDGTVTADAFAGPLTGDVTGNADTATVATTVTITDNESTNENNAVIFTAGGDVDGGNLGLESDGNLTYNPSSGTLTATAFAGNITGTVTGTATGLAGTPNIAVGTISTTGALTLGDYIEKTSGNLTIDVAGDIILDADGGDHYFKDGGTTLMHLSPHALGVGVSPEGAYNGYTSIEFGQQGAIFANDAADDFGLKVNTYLDSGGNWKRKETGVASSIDMDGDQIKIFTAASGSADANITFAQKFRLDNDGLKFGTDTAAANALNDYEEGTFTPSWTVAGGGSVTGVSSTNVGAYTKVGNIVHVTVKSYYVQTTGTVPTTYSITLPFQAKNTGGMGGYGLGQETGQTGKNMFVSIDSNATNAVVKAALNGAPPANSYMDLTFTYLAG